MNNYDIDKEEIIEYTKIINKIPLKYKKNIQKYILDRVFKNKRFKTIQSYCNDLINFIKYLERREKDIYQLKDRDLEQYKRYLLKCKFKAKSINRKLTSINQFLKFNNNQVKFTKVKEQNKMYLENVITKNEIDEMLKHCDNMRDKAIIMTLYKTGVRVSELLSISIKDIKKDVVPVIGKGGKHRDILAPLEIRKVWEEYSNVRQPSEDNQLFIGTRGPLKRGSINKIILKYSKKAKISKAKAHPHNFRHAYCKSLADEGNTIDVIADLAGHADVNTTRIYTRKTKEELLEIIEEM